MVVLLPSDLPGPAGDGLAASSGVSPLGWPGLCLPEGPAVSRSQVASPDTGASTEPWG